MLLDLGLIKKISVKVQIFFLFFCMKMVPIVLETANRELGWVTKVFFLIWSLNLGDTRS